MSATVELERIDKTYPAAPGRAQERIFTDFSLSVRPGELVAVVGASGTGKTTLLHLVAGLETPDRGRVQVGPTARTDPRLGVVFQQPRLLEWRSVRANVDLALKSAGMDTGLSQVVLEEVGLTEYADKYPSALSGGQRQRVAVARAFAIDPAVVLLDEPFSALDELTARRLRLLLQDLWTRSSRVGLLVTHSPAEAVFLADRVIVLAGRPVEVVREYSVTRPRPRSPEDPELFDLTRRIVADLV